jgi:hypothetical protein
MKSEIFLLLKQSSERVAYVGRLNKSHGYLIKEGIEGVIVILINQRNPKSRVIGEAFYQVNTRKPSADNHDFYCTCLHIVI